MKTDWELGRIPCPDGIVEVIHMIRQWDDFGISAEDTADFKAELKRAEGVARKRRWTYMGCLGTVPLSVSRSLGDATLKYQGRVIEGEAGSNFRVDYGKFFWQRFQVMQERAFGEPFNKDDLIINIGVDVNILSWDDIDKLNFSDLEKATHAYICTRGAEDEIEAEELERIMDDRVRTIDVDAKVKRRNIVITGQDLELEIAVNSCASCSRPYFEFSDLGIEPDEGGCSVSISVSMGVQLPGLEGIFGMNSHDDAGNDHISGFTYFTSPYGDMLCSPRCAQKWYDLWDAKVKSPAQVKRIAETHVGSELADTVVYDLADVMLMKDPDGNPAWGVHLYDVTIKPGADEDDVIYRRGLLIDLDGEVIKDHSAED